MPDVQTDELQVEPAAMSLITGLFSWLQSTFLSWGLKKTLDTAWAHTAGKLLSRRKDSRGVLVIGPGGVGKTTFGQMVCAQSLHSGGPYDESVKVEVFKLRENPSISVWVPPGQDHRQETTWTSLLQELKDGKFRGVVFIGAFGHHSLGDLKLSLHPLNEPELPLEQFYRRYQADRLSIEKTCFKQICDAIKACNSPLWLLILVTKEDLWWDRADEAKTYYQSGLFKNVAKSCRGQKKASEIRVELAYASIRIQNLQNSLGELIKETVSGYDHDCQQRSFANLNKVFKGLLDWENGKK